MRGAEIAAQYIRFDQTRDNMDRVPDNLRDGKVWAMADSCMEIAEEHLEDGEPFLASDYISGANYWLRRLGKEYSLYV